MLEQLLKKWFEIKLSSQKIDRVLTHLKIKNTGINTSGDGSTDASSEGSTDASGEGSTNAPGERSRTARVSCVQRQIRLAGSVKDYIIMLYGFVKLAAKEKSQLVVFPEYNFFDLFGLIPGFKLIDSYLSGKAKSKVNSVNRTKADSTDKTGTADMAGTACKSETADAAGTEYKAESEDKGSSDTDDSGYSFFNKIFSAASEPVEAALLRIMSALAAHFKIYIYSGSYLSEHDDGLYNSGTLFGPDGRQILTQNKIHLTEFEIKIGLKCCNNLQVFPIFGTKAAMPICMDATYFETFHAARSAGADIVILPIANMEEYSLWRALRGIWPRVQEACVFGLKASLNGWIAGMHFTGKAGIFAPVSLTPDGKGILAISSHFEGDELVIVDLDFDALEKVRTESEYYGDINPEFERDYITKAYGNVKGIYNI